MRLRLALACAAVAGLAAAQESVNRTLASNILWANGYSFGRMGAHPHAGVETSDGGFLMVGDGRDRNNKTVLRHILILKTNSRGGLEWQLKLGDCGWNYGKFGIELNDKTFLVAGAFCGPRKTSDGNSLKRTLFRIGWKGELLNTQSFDNPIEQHGKRDIFMCVSHTQGEGKYVILTGTVGGENMTENVNRQYQDEPLFLLYGGNAFIMKLSYGEPSEPLGVVFDNKIALQNVTYEASQGMRVYHNQQADHYAIAIAMAETPGVFQFGAASTTTTGQLNWAQMFVAERGGHDGHESHPYTMVVPEDGSGYVVGGHSVIYDSKHLELCQGRLIKIDPRGNLLFDRRFQAAQRDTNIECYGVDSTSDGGLIMTCGMGVEPELHPDDSRELQTWMVLIHRTDAFGHTLWQANFTTNQQYFNNAGEFVLHTRSGDFAAFVDSQTWGSRDTDGNFGLMKLAMDWTELQAKKGQTLVGRSASAKLDRDEALEMVNLDTPVVFSGGREKPVTLVLLSPAQVARAKLAAEGAEPSSFPRIARLLGSEGRQQPLMPAGLEVPTPVLEAHVEKATSRTS